MSFPICAGSMKIRKKHIYIILAIFTVALCIIASAVYHIENEKFAPHYPKNQVSVSVQISSEELKAFLRTWIKYCEEYEHGPQIPELSYDTTDGSNQLDSKLSAWLRRRGWDVNRFVHINTRLRVIILTILRDREVLKKQRLMQDGADNAEDSKVASTLRRAADLQRRNLNVEKISPQERQLVEPQLEGIIKLLTKACA